MIPAEPRHLFALSLGFAAALLAAEARAACGPRDQVIAALAQRYGESPRAVGLASNGAVVELLQAEGGSWTIIASTPDGTSCLVASGQDWMALPLPVKGAPV